MTAKVLDEMSSIQVKEEKIDLEINEKLKQIDLIKNIKVEENIENTKIIKEETLNNNHNYTNNKNVNDNGKTSGTETASSSDEEEHKKLHLPASNPLPAHEDEEIDEKNSIQPFKSSNEILAELFKVFNAAPPEQLLDDENLLKKAVKRKKHKKDKKSRKRTKIKIEHDDENAIANDVENENHRTSSTHKRKHKKKNKHKDRDRSKEKKGSNDYSKHKIKKECSSHEPSVDKASEQIVKEEKHSSHRKHQSKEHCSEEKSNRKRNSFYNGFTEQDERNDKRYNELSGIKIKIEPKDSDRRTVTNDGNISEVSLSDEETYLRERNNAAGYKNNKSERQTSWKEQKPTTTLPHNSFYSNSTDKDRKRDHERDRERDRDRDHRNKHYRRDLRRTRSRSRSKSLGIDKKRLLEIARKNVISMLKIGCTDMSDEVKDEVLLKMRYGGRTVEDLTDFCKKLSKGEALSDLSSEEDSDVDKNGNSKAFHHPFQLKEREPIVMHIRNSNPIPPRNKTQEQAKAITMQFPVSSGQQHRISETWIPVAAKETLPPLPSLPAAQCSTNLFKASGGVQKNIFEKSIPIEQKQEPAFKPIAPTIAVAAPAPATTEEIQTEQPLPVVTPAIMTHVSAIESPTINTAIPPPNMLSLLNVQPPPLPPPPININFVPDVPIPSSAIVEVSNVSQQPLLDSIFPQSSDDLDVSNIISKRLSAMRRLQENPMDSEAIKMMYNSQKEMSTWASSKHMPGQFTGSTGANILKVHELNSGPQVWARRDQLTSSRPVTGGVGMHLLQKMGWKPGEGLGREKTGSLQPLLLDVKLDKRGLIAREDNSYQRLPVPGNRKRNNGGQTESMSDKHPVCLLNELTSKNKWTPPLYELVNEKGPSHQKQFQFSVSINGEIFTPGYGSNTKKEAKCETARYCLKQMGLLPNP